MEKSSNKKLINILKKTVAIHHNNIHTQLFNALWEDHITPKTSTGNSPYCLVYGKEVVLPSNLLLPSLQLDQSFLQDESSPLHSRIDTLLKLEEEREKYRNKLYEHQRLVKRWFDEKSLNYQNFHVGDLVLKRDKPHKDKNDYTKFQRLWLGPFTITKNIGPGTIRLQTLEGFLVTPSF